MTQRTNKNSIIFLATLGVYLGLVLTGGAAPQVFAHGALTRNFDIVDEIEFKDDLDNKPDDERSTVNESVSAYLGDVEQFLHSLRKLAGEGRFDHTRDSFFVSASSSLPCVAGNNVGSYTRFKFENRNKALTSTLERFAKQLHYGYSLPDCVADARFAGQEACSSNFDLKLERSELSLELVVKRSSPQSASELISSLRKSFSAFKKQGAELAAAVIDNTNFASTNDQVTVVTRLPRAGLDSLLAKNAQ